MGEVPSPGLVISNQCSNKIESNFSLTKFCESYVSGVKNVRMFEFYYSNRIVAYPVVSQEIIPVSFDTGFTSVKYTLFTTTTQVGNQLNATTFDILVVYENKNQVVSIVSAEGKISSTYYFKSLGFQTVVRPI